MRHTELVATREYVDEVRRHLRDISPYRLAEAVADLIVSEVERTGGERAQLVFDTDGNGPWCSWCGAIAGLCRHIALRKPSTEVEE